MPLRMCRVAWGLAAMSLLVGVQGHAYSFGDLALISPTMGANAGRVCIGDSAPDIGCPTNSPYLTSGGLLGIGTTNPQTALEVSGTVSASHFVGDGSGLTGVAASTADRIVSGTTSMVAVSATGYVSLTQAGSNTGWFDPTRGLVTLGVSATGGISGTTGYFSGNVGIGTSAPNSALVVGGNITTGNSTFGLVVAGVSNSFGTIGLQTTSNDGFEGINMYDDSGARVASAQYANSGASVLPGALFVGPRTVSAPFHLIAGASTPTPRVTILASGNVGIGTTTPSTVLETISTASSGVRGIMSSQYSTDAAAAVLRGRKSRGTVVAPTAVASGDYIAAFGADAYDGSAFQTPAFVGFIANGTIATGSIPTDFIINTGSASNGSERMRVTSGGNVGIGTTNPNAKLDVIGTISASNVYVTATTGVVSGTYGYFKYISATNLSGAFSTDRISTSGVAGGATLGMAVADKGTVSFTLGGTAGAAYLHPTLGFVGPGVSTTGGISGTTGYFSSSVGIGTTNPSKLLHIAGSSPGIRLTDTDTSAISDIHADSSAGSIAISADSGNTVASSAVNFYVDNSLKALINSSGNVGIGTTAPASTLHVSGTGLVAYFGYNQLVDQYISVRDGAGLQLGLDADLPSSNGSGLIQTGENKGLGFVVSNSTFGSAATPQMFIDGNGKVGIGTTAPSTTLQVSGTSTFGIYPTWVAVKPGQDVSNLSPGTNTLGGAIIEGPLYSHLLFDLKNNNTDDAIAFRRSAANNGVVDTIGMVFRGDGKVGIGTSNPNATLDVNGGISGTTGYFSGNLMVKGDTLALGATATYINIMTSADVSSLNPGSSNLATVMQGPLNTHLIFDLRNNNVNDAIAFRYSAAGNTVVDTVGMVLQGGGNVGINTTSPNAKLEVNGTVSATNIQAAGTLKVGVYSSQPVACGASYKGMIAMTSAGHICACDGSGWKDVGASYAACSW
jgi:hypothetical protein